MNYHQKHLYQIAHIHNKPSLLMHVCCGVCSVYPLQYLSDYFKVTIFFSNSNIYPYEEYEKRLDALKRYLNILNNPDIKLIIPKYDNENYMKDLIAYKDEPEGGQRCKICYQKRMEETFIYANKEGYDYCTTVMSISNRKNADWLNEIGANLQEKYPNTTYLYADFKKDGGIIKNEQLNKKLNLYHQNYCGCLYSVRN